MTPALIFSLVAAAALVFAFLHWLEIRRTARALPRMTVTTGVARELESLLSNREAGSVKSTTLVKVEFSVGGKIYTCRTLRLFQGNWSRGDVGKKFDFPPGQQVGVYYDPHDPRRSALMLDKPRYDSVGFTVLFAGIFVILAAVSTR